MATNMANEDATTNVAAMAESATAVDFPTFGIGTYKFYLVHSISMTTLFVSIVMSTGVLIHVRPGRKFFTWPIGDRIVVYLAIYDLIYSVEAIVDQIWMLAIEDNTPDVPCAVLGFLMNQGITGQALVVIFAAVNAFVMVALKKKLNTGKYDWRLNLYAFGLPAFLGLIAGATGYLGPSGAWCYIDLRKPLGLKLNTAVTTFMLITFAFTVICYGGIWIIIKRAAKTQSSQNNKYTRTAKVMMLFVLAYIAQWISAVVYATWSRFTVPYLFIMINTMSFTNLGGLFNFLAYSWIRKKLQGKVGDNKAGSAEGEKTTTTTTTTTTGEEPTKATESKE